jgi:hypothetical protein
LNINKRKGITDDRFSTWIIGNETIKAEKSGRTALPVSELHLGSLFLFVEGYHMFTEKYAMDLFPAYSILEILKPSSFLSLPPHCQPKMAPFLLRWLVGCTNHMPNVVSKGLFSRTLGVVSKGWSCFCSMDRLSTFQIFSFWFLSLLQFISLLSPKQKEQSRLYHQHSALKSSY